MKIALLNVIPSCLKIEAVQAILRSKWFRIIRLNSLLVEVSETVYVIKIKYHYLILYAVAMSTGTHRQSSLLPS